MDASRKPQMTREMVMRLSGPRNGSIDGFKAYGLTERSLKANRQTNLDRRYVKNYRASMVANSSAGVRRFGAEIGAASGAGANNSSPSLTGGNRQINSTALGRGGGGSGGTADLRRSGLLQVQSDVVGLVLRRSHRAPSP